MIYKKYEKCTLYHGLMQDELENLADNSVDSIVTDPPYELNFMNKAWDNSGVAFQADTWRHCLRVLKPGGFLLAFGGSRTFHRMACAIEDAGFEIRDTILWIFGSGFPHSLNLGIAVESKLQSGSANTKDWRNLDGETTKSGDWGLWKNSKEYGCRPRDYGEDGHERLVKPDYKTEEGKRWDGWFSALKPSFEPVIVARKPCDGTLTDNVLKWGVGGLNIDECRIPLEENYVYKETNRHPRECNVFTSENCGYKSEDNHTASASMLGRYPANTIFTYDDTDFDEVCGGLPSGGQNGSITKRYDMNNQVYGDYGKCNLWEAYNDSGSAARYFYCAKANLRDREEGCEKLEYGLLHRSRPDKNPDNPTGLNVDSDFAPVRRKNTHTTVKPCALCQYLIRLVTPKGGTILDPFMGSGSTGKAAFYENFDRNADYKFIGIEMTAEYLPIAAARIEFAMNDKRVVETEQPASEQSTDSQVKFDL